MEFFLIARNIFFLVLFLVMRKQTTKKRVGSWMYEKERGELTISWQDG